MFKPKKAARMLVTSCLCLLCALTLFPSVATAQVIDSSDFTVRAVIPENQIDKSKSYFDLLMTPGQSQTLSVDVLNSGTEEITIEVSLHAASTNRNGLIEYQVAVAPDETLKYPFDRLASAVNEVKVAARSIQTVTMTVTMPDEEFDGVILGAIIFTKLEDNEGSGIAINNQFSYVIGVKLSETSKEIAPDFRLTSIEPTLINYRRAVSINIHNPVPLIVKDANITAEIYQKNETTPLLSINKNGIEMAPNSVLPLPVEWEGNEMVAGAYRVRVRLTHAGKIWEWDQDFTLEAGRVDDVNQGALDKTKTPTNWWAAWGWIPAIVIVIILLWIAFLLGRRRKDAEETKIKNKG